MPLLGELRLPVEVGNLANFRRGLVLIGGAAGAGKSTTLAALVNEINQRDARHIVTIEDPVEYEHQHVRSVIEQVEVGTDAPDFPTALRAALRQAPDVLVVGEMRDPESMAIAVSAAETGHLVLSTLMTKGKGSITFEESLSRLVKAAIQGAIPLIAKNAMSGAPAELAAKLVCDVALRQVPRHHHAHDNSQPAERQRPRLHHDRGG